MPKLIIIDPCLINLGDDRGGVHAGVGEQPDVGKDVALALVRAGRALYASKADDPDKSGRNTATPEMLRAADAMAKPAKEKKPEEKKPEA